MQVQTMALTSASCTAGMDAIEEHPSEMLHGLPAWQLLGFRAANPASSLGDAGVLPLLMLLLCLDYASHLAARLLHLATAGTLLPAQAQQAQQAAARLPPFSLADVAAEVTRWMLHALASGGLNLQAQRLGSATIAAGGLGSGGRLGWHASQAQLGVDVSAIVSVGLHLLTALRPTLLANHGPHSPHSPNHRVCRAVLAGRSRRVCRPLGGGRAACRPAAPAAVGAGAGAAGGVQRCARHSRAAPAAAGAGAVESGAGRAGGRPGCIPLAYPSCPTDRLQVVCTALCQLSAGARPVTSVSFAA